MKSRKRVFISLEPSVFHYFIKKGKYEIVGSPIPKDAKYIATHYDIHVDRFLVCFEHKDFKSIPEGVCLPIIDSLRIVKI